MADWTLQRRNHEWLDGQTWHVDSVLKVVSPQGREVSLEEVVEQLNRYAMAVQGVLNDTTVVVDTRKLFPLPGAAGVPRDY